MLWLGLDDTDSPSGGCTTHVLTELLALARDEGLDLVGEPRLVRLNPNVPWKTRGNAALAARFGRGRGRRRRVGEVAGKPIWSYASGTSAPVQDRTRFLESAWSTVRRESRLGEAGTGPAMVASPRRLPARVYWRAVREIVPVAEVRAALVKAGAQLFEGDDDRGLVGAAAAVAWPGRRATWEVIAYRRRDRIGLARRVSKASVRRAERAFPDLFLCHDPRTRRLLVAPHTNCPILYGLRGTTPLAPLRARGGIVAEPVDRWQLYRTNQGSGDHLTARLASDWPLYSSAIVDGTVAGAVSVGPGGHVRFPLRDAGSGLVDCIAFEPTKTLPRVAAQLLPGDRVRIWGSRGADPTVRLEGLDLLATVANGSRVATPACPNCHTATRSLGRAKGYRCDRCRLRVPPEAARPRPRSHTPLLGRYMPTPSARRHLAPLGPEFDGRALEALGFHSGPR